MIPFFFDNDLNFENNLYIIKYVVIVIIIMNKIILRESVENSNNQPYPVNGLAVIIPTFVFRSCYYSLMKPIQSFVPHYSTACIFFGILWNCSNFWIPFASPRLGSEAGFTFQGRISKKTPFVQSLPILQQTKLRERFQTRDFFFQAGLRIFSNKISANVDVQELLRCEEGQFLMPCQDILNPDARRRAGWVIRARAVCCRMIAICGLQQKTWTPRLLTLRSRITPRLKNCLDNALRTVPVPGLSAFRVQCPHHAQKRSTFALPGGGSKVAVPGAPSEARVRAVTTAAKDFSCRPLYVNTKVFRRACCQCILGTRIPLLVSAFH